VLHAARLLAGGAPELELRLDPAHATEFVGLPARLSVGDQQSTAHHDVLERSDRRQLAVGWLATVEEGDVEAGFHGEKA
jgi:hypothetical protein